MDISTGGGPGKLGLKRDWNLWASTRLEGGEGVRIILHHRIGYGDWSVVYTFIMAHLQARFGVKRTRREVRESLLIFTERDSPDLHVNAIHRPLSPEIYIYPKSDVLYAIPNMAMPHECLGRQATSTIIIFLRKQCKSSRIPGYGNRLPSY